MINREAEAKVENGRVWARWAPDSEWCNYGPADEAARNQYGYETEETLGEVVAADRYLISENGQIFATLL